MLVAIDNELRDFDGQTINDPKGQPARVRGVCIDALLAAFQDEPSLAGEEKLKRFQLALKVKESNSVADLTAEEITLIKKLVGKAYAPIVVGQVWTILESRAPLEVVKEDEA